MKGYPYDGRSASDSPGLWAELLSLLPNWFPWEWFVVPLNSKLDIFLHSVQMSHGPGRTRRKRQTI